MAAYSKISQYFYIGAAADVKPVACEIGTKCYEHDTKKWYITYNGGTNWVEMQDIDALVLGAGSALVGKVGIDQTTPGITNGVRETFGGAAYENQDTASADTARRFETTSKKLRDIIIQVSTKAQFFGTSSNQRYRVEAGQWIGLTRIDISTLYFKNATAGENGTVNIIGVEE